MLKARSCCKAAWNGVESSGFMVSLGLAISVFVGLFAHVLNALSNEIDVEAPSHGILNELHGALIIVASLDRVPFFLDQGAQLLHIKIVGNLIQQGLGNAAVNMF